MSFDGATREYTLHPPFQNADGPLPVILNLHGFTSNMEQEDAVSNLPHMAGERGYLVVTPQALPANPLGDGAAGPFWNVIPLVAPAVDTSTTQTVEGVTDDLGFLAGLLDELESTYCIDESREYATGISLGGAMTAALACDDGDRFAAVAPVASVNIVKVCDAERATPTIAFHGDADTLVPYEGGGMFGFDLGLASVEERMGDIASAGGCDSEPAEEHVADDVTLIRWACPSGMDVELYKIIGGGHTWPGAGRYLDDTLTGELPPDIGGMTDSIVATTLMLDFFDEHRLQ